MNTFLPYKSFVRSAKVLDRRRLGKQRVEVLQILKSLAHGEGAPWYNHPAVRMWRDNPHSLIEYGLAICSEWVKRGYSDTCYKKIEAFRDTFHGKSKYYPSWLGDPRVHFSHQANLVRKDPEHYSKYFPFIPEENRYDYCWPTKVDSENWNAVLNLLTYFEEVDGDFVVIHARVEP